VIRVDIKGYAVLFYKSVKTRHQKNQKKCKKSKGKVLEKEAESQWKAYLPLAASSGFAAPSEFPARVAVAKAMAYGDSKKNGIQK
jgi:hypothetical protein